MARSILEITDMLRVGWKKCNRSSRECMVSQFATMHSVFSGMLMYLQLNDQPVRERVTTSLTINSSFQVLAFFVPSPLIVAASMSETIGLSSTGVTSAS